MSYRTNISKKLMYSICEEIPRQRKVNDNGQKN